MSNYRILQKSPKEIEAEFVYEHGVHYMPPHPLHVPETHKNCRCYNEKLLIPRYIVQREVKILEDYSDWEDVKEFDNLEGARQHKHELQLVEGIVHD